MTESERGTHASLSGVATAVVLLAGTAIWGGALWLALSGPELLADYGAEAQLVVLGVAWLVPALLTLWAWLTLRRARRVLSEVRAQIASAEAKRQAARDAADQRKPPASPKPADATPSPEPPAPERNAAPSDLEPGPDGPVREGLWTALDFPSSEADTAGFEALRRALAEDRQLALVIRTAQLALSLLAQEGVHLPSAQAPEPPPPEVLRRYAAGARGTEVAALGATADRESLAKAVGRMRRDPAFRSAAHRFVAAFEAWLRAVVPDTDDATLSRIAGSRSGRAFRLLGRATGNFG